MKTIKIKIYTYDELEDNGKINARNWFLDGNLDWNWYEFTYEDAASIGIKINSFNLYTHNIKGEFINSAIDTAKKILVEYGKDSDLYKLAFDFSKTYSKLDTGDYKNEDIIEDLESEFLHNILEEYLSILFNEYDYYQSEEYIAESMSANGYEFLEDGRRFLQ